MTYRKATMEDSQFLLDLKNDKDVIKYSIVTKKKIELPDHIKWLKKHLSEITIILYRRKRVGDIRITDGEIAIKILKEYRGKGIGFKALKKFAKEGMTANIVEGNEASIKLFLRNGFVVMGFVDNFVDNYYILQK